MKATPNGLFIDHKILLILNKLHQYEQSPLRRKKTRIQLELETDLEKKTARAAISRLGQGINRLIPCIRWLGPNTSDYSDKVREPQPLLANLVDYIMYKSANPCD